MPDVLELAVLDVEHVTVRSVSGHDNRAEHSIHTRRGTLTLDCSGRGVTSSGSFALRKE